jgi:hypothetical protein
MREERERKKEGRKGGREKERGERKGRKERKEGEKKKWREGKRWDVVCILSIQREPLCISSKLSR